MAKPNTEILTVEYQIGALLRRQFRNVLNGIKFNHSEVEWFTLEFMEQKGFVDSMFHIKTHYYVHKLLMEWCEEVNG